MSVRRDAIEKLYKFKYVVVIALVVVLITASAVNVVYSIPPSPSTTATYTQWAGVDDCTHIIFNDGTNTYAKNCNTGQIDYSGTSAAAVIQSTLTADSAGGKIFIRKAAYSIGSSISATVGHVDITAEQGTTFSKSANFVLLNLAVTDYISIRGGIYDGGGVDGTLIKITGSGPNIKIGYFEDITVRNTDYNAGTGRYPSGLRLGGLTNAFVNNFYAYNVGAGIYKEMSGYLEVNNFYSESAYGAAIYDNQPTNGPSTYTNLVMRNGLASGFDISNHGEITISSLYGYNNVADISIEATSGNAYGIKFDVVSVASDTALRISSTDATGTYSIGNIDGKIIALNSVGSAINIFPTFGGTINTHDVKLTAIVKGSTSPGFSTQILNVDRLMLDLQTYNNTGGIKIGNSNNVAGRIYMDEPTIGTGNALNMYSDVPVSGVDLDLWFANSSNNWKWYGTSSTTEVQLSGKYPTPSVFDGHVVKYRKFAGTATIASGTTSITVTHNLSYTPNTRDITVTPTNNPTNDPGNYWISNLTSTQFTINVRSDPGAGGAIFAWQAQKQIP